jgi:glycosyltransferase involved in cell wall biosynthesis
LYLIDGVRRAGGAERFAAGLAAALPTDRFDVWMCSTRLQEPSAAGRLAASGVKLIHLKRTSSLDLHRFRPLTGLMRQQRFDVLHAHMFGSNFWGSIFGRMFGVPVIIAHEHNWAYTGEPHRVLIDRHVVGRLATRFVAVSEANRQRMITVERIPGQKIVVMPTAYIPHVMSEERDIRAELDVSHDSPIIATAAILRPEKRLDVLIEAHAGLERSVHLVIAGEGPGRSSLEHLASNLGSGERVHFLGLRSDVDMILRSADVGALSSDWEGMPLFALECMAAGTPLVATAVGGLPELVEPGQTGLLVKPGDPSALREALASVIGQPELGQRLAAAAKARLEPFRIASVAERFANFYEELLTEAMGDVATVGRALA